MENTNEKIKPPPPRKKRKRRNTTWGGGVQGKERKMTINDGILGEI